MCSVDTARAAFDNRHAAMVFSSIIFLFVFLPAVLAAYYLTPRSSRFLVLTAFSYAFYAWADPRYVLLLWWVTLVDFTIGNLLGRRHDFSAVTRRTLLALSLANSIGLLVYFKYAVLAHSLAGGVAEWLGAAAWPVLHVVLPAGISFYTFESISYVVDVYRRDARPAGEAFARAVPIARRTPLRRAAAQGRALVTFACYLAQFPHLVAGPIIRYQELEPQLHHPRTSVDAFARGSMLFSFGLAKKVLIANSLALPADAGFGTSMLSWGDSWITILAYSFQIYFDFSGYSDMACGLALMLGFQFPRNFDAPYRAASVADFWRRWHMTLSRWLRDYLYVPLGGNRNGRARTYVNLLLTMTIGGIWHGASLNFAVWGLWHGALLAAERAIIGPQLADANTSGMRQLAGVAVTFVLVCIGWTIFRAESLGQVLVFVNAMFVPGFGKTQFEAAEVLRLPRTFVALGIAAVLAFGGVQAFDVCKRITPLRAACAMLLFAISAGVLTVQAANPFLYFRF